MKLLFDANISHRLLDSLSELYPDSTHVRLVGLERATDREVWDYARTNGFSIVSKDTDFYHLSLLHGSPPKVIWIRLGNCRTIEIEKAFRSRFESLTNRIKKLYTSCMQTKLTLRLEQELIERAKRIARRKGKSVSNLVADYFRSLETVHKEGGDIAPLTRSLHGILRGSSLDEGDFSKHLEKKHR